MRGPERVAEGVWLVRGGFPLKTMNVYLIEDDGGGVTMFDAGIKAMADAVAGRGVARSAGSTGSCSATPTPTTAAPRRRSGVPRSATPTTASTPRATAACTTSTSRSSAPPRALDRSRGCCRLLGRRAGEIAGTVEEGDDVAGFRVVHLPGHAPGQIALWRESDRLALTADCFYTLDPQHRPPRRRRACRIDALQPRHRAGARLDPQARRARAGAPPGPATPTR